MLRLTRGHCGSKETRFQQFEGKQNDPKCSSSLRLNQLKNSSREKEDFFDDRKGCQMAYFQTKKSMFG
jgi:hypothetical protein